VKDRVVLTGQFDAEDPDLNQDLADELQENNIALAQFFANAVDTRNMGIDLVLDYNKRWGVKYLRGIFTANVQNMDIQNVNVPAELAGSDFLNFINSLWITSLAVTPPPGLSTTSMMAFTSGSSEAVRIMRSAVSTGSREKENIEPFFPCASMGLTASVMRTMPSP
jgi:hypothetical protein